MNNKQYNTTLAVAFPRAIGVTKSIGVTKGFGIAQGICQLAGYSSVKKTQFYNPYFNIIFLVITLLSISLATLHSNTALAEPAVQLVNAAKVQQATEKLATPMGLTAFAGDGIIRLSWEKSQGAVLYKIFAATEPGVTADNFQQLKNGANFVAFDPHYLITNLNADTTYYFVVIAENGEGKSLPSPEISATTKKLFDRLVDKPIIPTTPESVKIENSKDELVVKWKPVRDAERYNVYLASESGVGKKSYKKLKNGMAIFNAKHPFVHRGLKKDTTYYVVVSAENQAGESMVSLEVSAKLEGNRTAVASNPPKPLIPETPSKLQASINQGNVVLNWKEVNAAKNYNLYYAHRSGVSPVNINKINGGIVKRNISMPFSIGTLVPGKDYYFTVTAQNDGGESKPSQEIKVSIPATTIPVPPPKIQVTQHNNEVILSWLDSPGATTHNVYVANEPGVSGNNIKGLSGGKVYRNVKSPLRLSKLPSATTFYFVATGKNDIGESTGTEEVSIKTKGKLPSPTVVAIADSDKTQVSKISVTPIPVNLPATLPAKNAELNLKSTLPESRRSNLYLALNNKGLPLEDQSVPFSSRPWSCVQSKSTGLIWEIKTNDGGLRDKNNTYTWYNPDKTENGGYSGMPNGGNCTGTPCDTMAYVTAINKTRLCGFNDWRLPTREELTTLIDPKTPAPNPVIDLQSFPFTSRSFHWTQSPMPRNMRSAWLISFESGQDQPTFKSQANHIRLVRGYPKPISRVLKPD